MTGDIKGGVPAESALGLPDSEGLILGINHARCCSIRLPHNITVVEENWRDTYPPFLAWRWSLAWWQRTKTAEFPSKSQEQTGLQERLRQLGQSQMQQFLLTQQMGKQQALIIQQYLQQKQHQEQQQRQGLPTDGVYRSNDWIPNSYRSSAQAPSTHPLPGHNMQSYQASVQSTTSHEYLGLFVAKCHSSEF